MKTIELAYPVTMEGVKKTSVQMRRPKVRDMLAAEKLEGSDAEREIRIFANLCELTPDQLGEFDIADYQKLQKAYQDFLS